MLPATLSEYLLSSYLFSLFLSSIPFFSLIFSSLLFSAFLCFNRVRNGSRLTPNILFGGPGPVSEIDTPAPKNRNAFERHKAAMKCVLCCMYRALISRIICISLFDYNSIVVVVFCCTVSIPHFRIFTFSHFLLFVILMTFYFRTSFILFSLSFNPLQIGGCI